MHTPVTTEQRLERYTGQRAPAAEYSPTERCDFALVASRAALGQPHKTLKGQARQSPSRWNPTACHSWDGEAPSGPWGEGRAPQCPPRTQVWEAAPLPAFLLSWGRWGSKGARREENTQRGVWRGARSTARRWGAGGMQRDPQSLLIFTEARVTRGFCGLRPGVHSPQSQAARWKRAGPLLPPQPQLEAWGTPK